MTHPGPLLTDYADGTIGDAERREVEAHLSSCATCRQEVALARAARASLRSLPVATPPQGLADAAIAEAGASAAPTTIAAARSARPRRGWIGAAAAAAAVLIVLVIASPKLGSSPDRTTAEQASSAGGAAVAFPDASAVDVVRADLSEDQLAAAAAALGGVGAPTEGASPASDVSAVSGGTAAPAVALPDLRPSQQLPDRLAAASACLDQAWGSPAGDLTRVVLARFQGTPAYFGVYAVGPGAGLPPTRLQMLVASVRGCQPLASAYALL